jgi:hypothetical protein
VLIVTVGWLGYAFVRHYVLRSAEARNRTVSTNNIRILIQLVSQDPGRRFPREYGGRNFVLSVVANGDVHWEPPGNRDVFFSPWVPEADRPAPDEYEAITHESLRTRRFPRFTSYAGRRIADPDDGSDGDEGLVPLIADLSFREGAIVGFADGTVKWMDREALGLGPDDPLVVGETSKSPILRRLSDE